MLLLVKDTGQFGLIMLAVLQVTLISLIAIKTPLDHITVAIMKMLEPDAMVMNVGLIDGWTNR